MPTHLSITLSDTCIGPHGLRRNGLNEIYWMAGSKVHYWSLACRLVLYSKTTENRCKINPEQIYFWGVKAPVHRPCSRTCPLWQFNSAIYCYYNGLQKYDVMPNKRCTLISFLNTVHRLTHTHCHTRSMHAQIEKKCMHMSGIWMYGELWMNGRGLPCTTRYINKYKYASFYWRGCVTVDVHWVYTLLLFLHVHISV